MTFADSEAGRASYAYDERGRVTAERRVTGDGVTYAFANEYDRADRILARTFPDGRELAYGYDALDRITKVSGMIEKMTYDPRGLLVSADTANGVQLKLGHDRAGLHTSIHAERDGAVLVDLERDIDLNGNPIEERDAVDGLQGKKITYTYDELDRLLTMTDNLGTTKYVHDEWNRLASIQSKREGYSRELKYGPGGSTALPERGRGKDLVWSPGGRMQSDGFSDYEWTAWGRVARIDGDDATSTLRFDHEERLASKTVGGEQYGLPSKDFRTGEGNASIVLRVEPHMEVVADERWSGERAQGAGLTNRAARPERSGVWDARAYSSGVLAGLITLGGFTLLIVCFAARPHARGQTTLAGVALLFVFCGDGSNGGADSTTAGSLTVRILDWQGTPAASDAKANVVPARTLPYGSLFTDSVPSGQAAFLGGENIGRTGEVWLETRSYIPALGVFASVDTLLSHAPLHHAGTPRNRGLRGFEWVRSSLMRS